MKTILATAQICSAASLFTFLALSAMTVAPPAKGWFNSMLATVAIMLVVWLALVFWTREKLKVSGETVVSLRFKQGVMVGAAIYLFLIFFCVLG
ncbi:MAG: hypothetical protein WCL04_02580 [Verrucomicrobiota bacterium]